jgi:YggT family protein
MVFVCQLVLAYQIVIIARVLLSWFPIQPGTVMARINGVLVRVTEPLLGPLRRVLPRMGMLDLSPLVAILLISVLSRVLLRC